MKIHGTAKGGAISKKDFGVAFSSGGSGTGISDADLKVYWKCNETETPVENKSESSDSLGTAADMDTTNVTFGETGILGDSILFNGTSYGNVGTSVSQFNFCHVTDHKWSIAFWYKSTNAPSAFETIFATAANSTSGDVGFVIALHSSRRFFIDMFDGNAGAVPLDDDTTENNIIPDDNEFHFYVFTFDATLASENLKIFVDGDEDYTANYTNPPDTTANASYLMWVGRRTNVSEKFLDGELDEVSIWDKILDSDTIAALYNSGDGQAIY